MIDAIVLAAGLGTRMDGAVKALTPIAGEPALSIVLRRLREAGIASPIVVLGHGADAVRRAVDLSGVRIVENPAPADGLSSSLRLGLSVAGTLEPGVLVLHADMPAVSAETIRAILEAAEEGARLAAPVYRGQRGFPVFVARSLFEELEAALEGDAGARKLLERHADDLILVPVEDPGCILDVDRPEDLEALVLTMERAERRSSCATSV